MLFRELVGIVAGQKRRALRGDRQHGQLHHVMLLEQRAEDDQLVGVQHVFRVMKHDRVGSPVASPQRRPERV
jgi:hypothetical protein